MVAAMATVNVASAEDNCWSCTVTCANSNNPPTPTTANYTICGEDSKWVAETKAASKAIEGNLCKFQGGVTPVCTKATITGSSSKKAVPSSGSTVAD